MILPALLIQAIIYLSLLLLNNYLGTLLCLVIGAICLAVWLISLIVEWIEPSRVPRYYYHLMISGFLAPVFSLFTFALLRGGMDWLPPEVNELLRSFF